MNTPTNEARFPLFLRKSSSQAIPTRTLRISYAIGKSDFFLAENACAVIGTLAQRTDPQSHGETYAWKIRVWAKSEHEHRKVEGGTVTSLPRIQISPKMLGDEVTGGRHVKVELANSV